MVQSGATMNLKIITQGATQLRNVPPFDEPLQASRSPTVSPALQEFSHSILLVKAQITREVPHDNSLAAFGKSGCYFR